jgi:hypothetical protein
MWAPYKFYGTHINFKFLTNKREFVEMCVRECVATTPLEINEKKLFSGQYMQSTHPRL